jgi:putative aldouronate transport system substrate-binding protein
MLSKKRFKGISLVLAFVLMAAMLLTACGQKGESNASATTQMTSQAAVTSTQQETTQKPLDPYEIIYYYGGSPQTDAQVVQEEMNKILKEKINATIKLNCVDWGQYNNKMQVTLATGDKVDLCFTSSWTNKYAEQVGKGAYLELSDLLEKYGADIKANIPEGWWGAPTINGKVYAVPNVQYAATTVGIQVRRDLAEKYNLDVASLKNLLDIEPFLKQVKENEKDVTPFEMYKNAGLDGDQLLLPFGYSCFADFACINLKSDPYKVLSRYELPEIADAWKAVRRWYESGYVPADAATKSDVSAEEKANKFAVIIPGNVPPFAELDWKAQMGTDMIIKPFADVNPIMSTASITSTMRAIPKSSKDPERAMMFLNLLFGDKQVYSLLCNGIEGTHYTKVGENVIESVADSKYNPGLDWAFGSVFNSFLKKGDPEDKLQQQKAANDKANISPLMGFTFDVTPVKTEQSQLSAALEEYKAGLSTGALDTDTYLPKMIDKLKKAGLDKYLAEIQKQIDDWRAANGK